MTYVYLANGRLGLEVLRWLIEQGDPPVGLVVHPPERQKFGLEILAVAGLPSEHAIEGPALRTPGGLAWLKAHEPQWLVSVLFGYILTPEVLAVPAYGSVNLHPAFLPYNRGAYPNVWSIVDRTPAGVTLHFLDAGVDTGDIIAQREVPVNPADTGASLYARLEGASLSLFQDHWGSLMTNSVKRKPQPEGGTSHRVSDVERIDCIEPDQQVRAGDLIDILRARTFPPYKGAYLNLSGRKVYLRLELSEEP